MGGVKAVGDVNPLRTSPGMRKRKSRRTRKRKGRRKRKRKRA
jgi:hypothetical protein